MNDFRIPHGRPGKRSYRYRPRNSAGGFRRDRIVPVALLAAAIVCLTLGLVPVVRSLRTARQNETFARWKENAETLTASAAARPEMQLTRMTNPDGSRITREEKLQSGGILPDVVTSTRYHRTDGSVLPSMAELLRKNRDLVAWLSIDHVLDLPVVYRDNEWYLNHDFEGKRSGSGTLFLDEDHPLDEHTQTLLIHGHNMKDGSMFAMLPHYRNTSFWKKHPFIHLTTLREDETYVIFAVLTTSADPSDSRFLSVFSHPTFGSDAEFEEYIALMKEHSDIPRSLSVRPEDALLELSTCVGEDRLVVAARRLREGESLSSLRQQVAASL